MGSRAAGTPAMDLVKDDDNEGHRDLITEVQVRIRDGGDMVVAAAVNMICDVADAMVSSLYSY